MSTSDFAGFWLRFVAFVVDSIVLSIIYLLVILPLFDVLMPIHYDEFVDADTDNFFQWIGFTFSYPEWILAVTSILYFTFMESSKYQASFGKLALELKVTDCEGRKLRFTKALLRNMMKIVSSLTLLVGYLMAGFTAKKQALHDVIANTLVVKK